MRSASALRRNLFLGSYLPQARLHSIKFSEDLPERFLPAAFYGTKFRMGARGRENFFRKDPSFRNHSRFAHVNRPMKTFENFGHVREEAAVRRPRNYPVTREDSAVGNERRKVVQFEVYFSDRSLAKPALFELTRDSSVSVNIRRGRLTETSAWFELELSGNPSRVDEVVRQSRNWGVLTWSIERDISCAS